MSDLGEYGSGEDHGYQTPIPPRLRLTPRHLVLIPLVLLLVDGVVLGERIQAQHGRDADPGRVATAFFTAVASDHATQAADLTRFPDADTRFTAADLRAEGGISRPTLTGIARRGDRGTVSVSYTVGGSVAHSDLVLARTYTGVLHDPTWRIVGGLPVVQVRAATFETTCYVNGRKLLLQHGAADVTVFPGLVTVRLPAHLPAGPAAQTVPATAGGTVTRLPAMLDADLQSDLDKRVYQAVVAMKAGTFVTTGAVDLDFHLGADPSHITFNGSFPFGTTVDATTGATLSSSPAVPVSGTATYAAGIVAITKLHIG